MQPENVENLNTKRFSDSYVVKRLEKFNEW